VQVIGRLHVGQVRVARQKRQRHVEGVGDVLLGGLHVGQGGQVAHRVRQQLHAHLRIGDQHFALSAADELLLPFRFQTLPFGQSHLLRRRQQNTGQAGVVVDAAFHGGVLGAEGHLLERGTQRTEPRTIRIAWIGNAKGDDPLGRKTLDGRSPKFVVIDELGTVRLAPRRHQMGRQDPDVTRYVQQRIELEQPVGRANHLEVELGRLKEIKAVVHRIDLAKQRQQRMFEDFFNGRLACQSAEMRRFTEPALRGRIQAARQASWSWLTGLGRHVQARRMRGHRRGIDAGARPGSVLELAQQLGRTGRPQSAVGVEGRMSRPGITREQRGG